MALITCPECGRDVSEYAEFCPQCGCPNPKERGERQQAEQQRLEAEEKEWREQWARALQIEEQKRQKQWDDLNRVHRDSTDELIADINFAFQKTADIIIGSWCGEPIEWRVLAMYWDNTALLVSTKGVERRSFNHDEREVNDWDSSELKQWLDNTFFPQAFDSIDKQVITEATCPSKEEYENNVESQYWIETCYPSNHAKEQGVGVVGKWTYDGRSSVYSGRCKWWLRPDDSSLETICVSFDSRIHFCEPTDNLVAVRPALRVKLGEGNNRLM